MASNLECDGLTSLSYPAAMTPEKRGEMRKNLAFRCVCSVIATATKAASSRRTPNFEARRRLCMNQKDMIIIR